jgi:hypothetical protein
MFNVGERVKVISAGKYSEEKGTIIKVGKTFNFVQLDKEEMNILNSEPGIGKYTLWFNKELIKIEEEKRMVKSELRTGHVVQHKNGKVGIISLNGSDGKNHVIDWAWNSHLDLDNYKEDMTWGKTHRNENWDIEKVFDLGFMPIAEIFQAKADGDKDGKKFIEGKKVVFQRENPKVKELEGLVTKLQGQLTDAQSELRRIKG